MTQDPLDDKSVLVQIIALWQTITRDNNNPVFGYPDGKVHGADIGPTWVLSAPDGPHVGPMNLAIKIHLYVTPPD